MRKSRKTTTIAAIALLLVGGVRCSRLALPLLSLGLTGVGADSWITYQSNEYGFLIKYPHDYVLAEAAFELAAPGAVVTFVPTFDPSADRTGANTNLLEVSVTVGVTLASALSSHRGFPGCDCCIVHRPSGSSEDGDGFFLTCRRTEGAAGHRFSLLSYSTVCGDRRYEIALCLHYANPDCYSPGTIRSFDQTEIVRVFEAMVGAFRCRPKG